MNRTDLETVANLIIDEEFDKANILINKIMTEETKRIYKERLIEDGDLKDDKKCQDGDDCDDDDCDEHGDKVTEAFGDEDNSVTIDDTDNDEVTDVEQDDDIDNQDSTTSEENPESSPEEIKYQFNDIQTDIARLKSEFNKIMGGALDDDDSTDSEESVEEDVYDTDNSGETDEASPLTYASEECEEDLNDEDNVFEDSDINDIAESLELSTVNCDLKSPKEAGNGKSVKTDNKSFVSKHEGDKGEPIEIKSSGEPKGTGREPSPAVKDVNYKSTNVMDLTKVSKEGDKSAKINSKDGFGKDNDGDSPLSKIKR